MNKSLIKAAIVLAFASAASGALAQTGTAADSTARAKSFSDQFAVMQSLSANGGPTFQLSKPQFGLATDPTKGVTFAELQAESSNSSMWQPQAERPSALAADPVPRGGLSIAQYQALSSESALWQLPVQAATTAVASSASTDVAQVSGRRPFAERWAAFFRLPNKSEGPARWMLDGMYDGTNLVFDLSCMPAATG
jgi:hypothetical protein